MVYRAFSVMEPKMWWILVFLSNWTDSGSSCLSTLIRDKNSHWSFMLVNVRSHSCFWRSYVAQYGGSRTDAIVPKNPNVRCQQRKWATLRKKRHTAAPPPFFGSSRCIQVIRVVVRYPYFLDEEEVAIKGRRIEGRHHTLWFFSAVSWWKGNLRFCVDRFRLYRSKLCF